MCTRLHVFLCEFMCAEKVRVRLKRSYQKALAGAAVGFGEVESGWRVEMWNSTCAECALFSKATVE